jgi:hypothetical protein
MNIFYRPQYKSDITLFIEQLKARKPLLEEGQHRGMKLLWDKTVDIEAWKGYRQAQIPQNRRIS